MLSQVPSWLPNANMKILSRLRAHLDECRNLLEGHRLPRFKRHDRGVAAHKDHGKIITLLKDLDTSRVILWRENRLPLRPLRGHLRRSLHFISHFMALQTTEETITQQSNPTKSLDRDEFMWPYLLPRDNPHA
jgi:hypothetical protein